MSDCASKVRVAWATYGDKLLVLGVLAVGGKHSDESLLSVESLEDFVKSLDKS